LGGETNGQDNIHRSPELDFTANAFSGKRVSRAVLRMADVDADFESAERFPCIRPFRVSVWVCILEADMNKRDDAMRALIMDPVLQLRLSDAASRNWMVFVDPLRNGSRAMTYLPLLQWSARQGNSHSFRLLN
jgi:hypothetical protein